MFNRKLNEKQKRELDIVDQKLKDCKERIRDCNKSGNLGQMCLEIETLKDLINDRDKIKPLTYSEKLQVKMILSMSNLITRKGQK
jgi:hypothetical protein